MLLPSDVTSDHCGLSNVAYGSKVVLPWPIFSLVLDVASVGLLFCSNSEDRQRPLPFSNVAKTSTVDVDTGNCRPTRVLSSQ